MSERPIEIGFWRCLKEHPKTSLNSPTVSTLTDPDWLALETIIPEEIVRHIMPQLYQAGMRDCGVSDRQDH